MFLTYYLSCFSSFFIYLYLSLIWFTVRVGKYEWHLSSSFFKADHLNIFLPVASCIFFCSFSTSVYSSLDCICTSMSSSNPDKSLPKLTGKLDAKETMLFDGVVSVWGLDFAGVPKGVPTSLSFLWKTVEKCWVNGNIKSCNSSIYIREIDDQIRT